MEPFNFSPKVEYILVLDKLRESFNKRYNTANVPSPSNGLDHYKVKAILGTGSFGKVLLVKQLDTESYFAAKMLSKDHIVKTKQVSHVVNEKRVLNSVRFPNVIHLIAACKDTDSLYLIIPVISGGELFTYHRKMRKFSEKHARFYAAQVFLALEYLHHCSMLYRDLKPENIMIDKNGFIKVTDFGFAKKVETRTMTLCGTPEYLPPEIIKSKPYGTSVDWWAFGVLIYELVAGHSPFAQYSKDVMAMYAKICEGNFKLPSSFSSSLKHLVSHLLQVDLSKRFGNLINGNKDIKDHEWFRDTEWIPMLNQTLRAPYVPIISHPEDVSNFDKYPEYSTKNKAKTMRHEDVFVEF